MKTNLIIVLLALVFSGQIFAGSKKGDENFEKLYVMIPKPLENPAEFAYSMMYESKKVDKRTQVTTECFYAPVLPNKNNNLTKDQAVLSAGVVSVETETVKKSLFGSESETTNFQTNFGAPSLNNVAIYLSEDLKNNRADYDKVTVYFMNTKMMALDVNRLLQSPNEKLQNLGKIVKADLSNVCNSAN